MSHITDFIRIMKLSGNSSNLAEFRKVLVFPVSVETLRVAVSTSRVSWFGCRSDIEDDMGKSVAAVVDDAIAHPRSYRNFPTIHDLSDSVGSTGVAVGSYILALTEGEDLVVGKRYIVENDGSSNFITDDDDDERTEPDIEVCAYDELVATQEIKAGDTIRVTATKSSLRAHLCNSEIGTDDVYTVASVNNSGVFVSELSRKNHLLFRQFERVAPTVNVTKYTGSVADWVLPPNTKLVCISGNSTYPRNSKVTVSDTGRSISKEGSSSSRSTSAIFVKLFDIKVGDEVIIVATNTKLRGNSCSRQLVHGKVCKVSSVHSTGYELDGLGSGNVKWDYIVPVGATSTPPVLIDCYANSVNTWHGRVVFKEGDKLVCTKSDEDSFEVGDTYSIRIRESYIYILDDDNSERTYPDAAFNLIRASDVTAPATTPEPVSPSIFGNMPTFEVGDVLSLKYPLAVRDTLPVDTEEGEALEITVQHIRAGMPTNSVVIDATDGNAYWSANFVLTKKGTEFTKLGWNKTTKLMIKAGCSHDYGRLKGGALTLKYDDRSSCPSFVNTAGQSGFIRLSDLEPYAIKVKTPYENKGWNADTLFTEKHPNSFDEGTIIKLRYDDRTSCPKFVAVDDEDNTSYIGLSTVEVFTSSPFSRAFTGVKVFTVKDGEHSSAFDRGQKLVLHRDDKTSCPYFRLESEPASTSIYSAVTLRKLEEYDESKFIVQPPVVSREAETPAPTYVKGGYVRIDTTRCALNSYGTNSDIEIGKVYRVYDVDECSVELDAFSRCSTWVQLEMIKPATPDEIIAELVGKHFTVDAGETVFTFERAKSEGHISVSWDAYGTKQSTSYRVEEAVANFNCEHSPWAFTASAPKPVAAPVPPSIGDSDVLPVSISIADETTFETSIALATESTFVTTL